MLFKSFLSGSWPGFARQTTWYWQQKNHEKSAIYPEELLNRKNKKLHSNDCDAKILSFDNIMLNSFAIYGDLGVYSGDPFDKLKPTFELKSFISISSRIIVLTVFRCVNII
jgi:hypothetical protein